MQYREPAMAQGVFYTYWFEKNLQGDIVAVYNEATLDSNNNFGTAQNIVNYSLSTFTLGLGIVTSRVTMGTADALSVSLGVTGVGYMITTPIAMTFHLMNPNLANGEKAIMCGYELGVAVGGMLVTAALVAIDPAFGIVVLVSVVYLGVTIGAGQALQTGFENNNWR